MLTQCGNEIVFKFDYEDENADLNGWYVRYPCSHKLHDTIGWHGPYKTALIAVEADRIAQINAGLKRTY